MSGAAVNHISNVTAHAYSTFNFDSDHYATPRAGTFDCVDAVLPWRFEEEPLPLPPPVPPKNDLKVRSAAAAPGSIMPEEKRIPERVTPWLLRRVKTPVTRATQTAPAPASSSQKASTDNIRGGGTPKPDPPAYYHAVPQKQIYSSQESLVAIRPTRGPAATVVQTVPVPRTPPKPVAVPVTHRPTTPTSAVARGRETQQRVPTPTPSRPSCPQIRSVRSAPQEDTSRRPATRAPPRPVAVTVLPERRAFLPSYHSAEPFPSSPAPPPYRASAEDSYPTSVRSRSLPRSSRKHGGPTYEKEAAPLPPLPSHPLLSSSATSRIQAGHKVSKEFGDAIMKQELRLATPTSEHSSQLDPVPPNPPLLRQRFLSASELQSHRRAKLRTDKITPEQEARLRTSNKSSPNVGRCSGDSRQRAASAHPGRGQDKVSQRGRR
jgi:hypothetical protein